MERSAGILLMFGKRNTEHLSHAETRRRGGRQRLQGKRHFNHRTHGTHGKDPAALEMSAGILPMFGKKHAKNQTKNE